MISSPPPPAANSPWKWVALGCGVVGCLGVMGTSAVVGLAMLGASQAKVPNGPSPLPAPPSYSQEGEAPSAEPAAPSSEGVASAPEGSSSPSATPSESEEEGEEEREEREEESATGTGEARPGIEEALIKPQVGDYELATKENVTAQYAEVATEAVKCVYRSAAGAEITHLIIRCKDESTAGAVHESTISELEKRSYSVTDSNTVRNSSGQELGKRTFLLGGNRTVLWTNHATFCMAAGPEGDAQAFEKATSY